MEETASCMPFRTCFSSRKHRRCCYCCCGLSFMMLGLRGSSQKATNPAMPVPTTNGHTNGHANGHANGHTNGHTNGHSTEMATMNGSTINENHRSSTKYAESRTTNTDTRTLVESSHTRAFTTSQQVTVLRHTVTITRSKFCELSHVDDHYIDSMDVESFLEYIETERLTYMPQRGSKWDKVLKWAEFFALQVSGYENAVGSFVPESRIAAKLIWTACRFLIELGSENSQAIETAFAVFYKVGLQLKFFLRHGKLLSSNSHIRMEVGQAFNDLLILVRDVALHYHIQISTITSSQVDLDFNSLFGKSIDSFYARKDHIIEAMWACTQESESHDVHAIRKWLSVRDPVVRSLLRDRAATRARHDEYTCEWIQRTLLDFSRGNSPILALTGPSGSGKSILASWIVERLQRPLGKKTHDTLFLSVDPDLPNQATSLAISKNIALQLLQSNVGDIALLKALEAAFKASTSGSDAVKLEKSLWSAINVGIEKRKDENLIIVVDGLDERIPNAAKSVSIQIAELASKHAHVQAIILARNDSLLPKAMIHKFDITPDHTHNDVEHIAEHSLHGCLNFKGLKPKEQDEIVDHLVKAAHGNFLTVQLIAKALKHETTFEGFMKGIKVEKDPSKILPQLIRGLIARETNDLSKPEAVQILSWLITAERPLTTAEIKSLLRIDLKKKAMSTSYANIDEVIRDSCGSLLSTQNNIVRFRHGAIREQIIKISAENTKIQKFHDLNAGFVIRLLTYCAMRLPIQHAAVFDCPETSELTHFFNQDALLEYATRNWIFHFKNSSFYRGPEAFELSPEFKGAFPASVRLAAFEWLCWQTSSSTALEITNLHKLALKIRETVFSDKHESVFQTLIVCGRMYRTLSLVLEAGSCFYRATKLGQTLFKGYSAITTSCTTMYLQVTESIVSTTRTETVTRKEELLEYIITTHKAHFGKTSDTVIKHMKLLATLYISIQEEHKAETIWKELREIMVIRYGKGSSEETSVSGSLNIVIKRGEIKEEITEYEENIFETVTEMEIWDVRRIKIILELAITCETRGDILKAEEHYVMLWRGVIMHCHQVLSYHIDIDVHVSMIDIALEYVRFLRRHHRHEEAAGILICIWAEYEEYDFEYEIIFLRLKVVGELMRAVSLLSIAVSVFKKCWSWFKSHSLHEHTTSCQLLISETVEEITKSTTTTTTTRSTTTTTTSSTEVVIKEVFESSISKTTVTTETISICRSLISFYMKSEQWSEAIKTTKRSLELIWRMVISGGGTVALPREFGAEAIEIAIQLAICHHRSHHFHEAETLYLRIYRACINSCQIYDERYVLGYTTLIKFYSESGHWHKAIGIYKEILIATRKHFGAKDAKTIKILYTLGSLCHTHGHGFSYEYYEEIITVLNSGSTVCHHDAFEAMQIMCQFYFEEGHWQKLQLTCEMLWETWTLHHAEYRFEADFIELLYMRYLYVLENHCHVKYDIIRTITIQYRDVCIKSFGVFCSITVKALIALAQVCMRSEKYYHEAITHYEEVIKTTTEMSKSVTSTTTTTTSTSTVSSTIISTVKQQLTKAYIHVCNHGSVSTTILERAILVLTERFEYLKVTFGCAHIETLTVLRELILLHWTHVTKESRALVVKMLLETTILIITKEKNSKTLHEAAKKIAGIYLRCELHEEGRVMLREIHRQIVCRSYSSSDKCGFKIDHSVGKESYVFLVTFEQLIQGSVSISYSNIMADLLTETILFESYTRCVKSEKNIEVVLTAGARLFVFLHKSAWKEQSIVIRDELIKIFTKKWGTVVKAQGDITVLFVTSLLLVLSDETSHLHIGKAACKSSNNKVRELLVEGEYTKAYGVASCAFRFIEHLGAYHHLQNVGYGFKLSSLMALRGMKPLVKPVDPDTHTKMLDLSRKIISEVLRACKDSKINFVRLKLSELNELVGLLGEQQNYADLEWLLKSLWVSREVQKNWSPEIITGVGKRFVQALFLGEGERQKSITLCEAICYNLRRVYGALDPKALAMSELLSQVYTAAGRPKDAMRVHEDLLRLVVEGDDDDDRTLDTMEATEARKHLKLLKQAYIRAKGWDKKPSVYEELVHDLITMPAYKNSPVFTGVREVKQWKITDKLDTSVSGDFVKPTEWEFADPRTLSEAEKSSDKGTPVVKRHTLGLRRITSNWGMNIHLLGQKDEHDEMPSPMSPALNGHNGNGKFEPAILVKGPELKPAMIVNKMGAEEKVKGGKGTMLPPA